MLLKEKLQIVLITYNRCAYLERTLGQLLAENSPVRDFDIWVLDNNSTDDTAALAERLRRRHPSLSYHKNRYNLGIGGNIARALEMGRKEYLWVLCDDDLFDFSHWSEVEHQLQQGVKCLCVSRYALADADKNKPECQLLQMTFVPATIFHKSLFNDTVMYNVMENIYTLFPHLCPLVSYLNHGGKVTVLDHPVVTRKESASARDCSYWRGADPGQVYPRSFSMQWLVGYADVLALLKDKKLKARCLDAAASFPEIAPNFWRAASRIVRQGYQNPLYWVNVSDFSTQLNWRQKLILCFCRVRYWLKYGFIRFYSTKEGRFVRLLNQFEVKWYTKDKK